MIARGLALLVLALLALPAGAQAPEMRLDKIRKSGVVALGYIDGAAPFSFVDANGFPQGYSVELCRTVAAAIGREVKRADLKTRWVRLTIQVRIEAVRSGRVDVECSTTTWTLTRQRLVDFSLVTFVDGGSILTRAKSDAVRITDFGGRRLAVLAGTTTESALRAELARRAVKAEVLAVNTRDEGLELLRAGTVEGFASDRTALIGLVLRRAGGEGFALLAEDFSIEQYALMLPRGDGDFRLAVNRALARLYRSGEIARVYERWLGPLGPPSKLLAVTYLIHGVAE
jgi:ABC-type amino acid transport substrate-binding protein